MLIPEACCDKAKPTASETARRWRFRSDDGEEPEGEGEEGPVPFAAAAAEIAEEDKGIGWLRAEESRTCGLLEEDGEEAPGGGGVRRCWRWSPSS